MRNRNFSGHVRFTRNDGEADIATVGTRKVKNGFVGYVKIPSTQQGKNVTAVHQNRYDAHKNAIDRLLSEGDNCVKD